MATRTKILPKLFATAACALAVLASNTDAAAVEENDKAGPWMANFKIGPALKITDRSVTQFAMQMEIAYAVIEEDGYLGFAPQFQFGNRLTTITLPLAFQYDIHMPVENLYLYPRIEAGLAVFPDSNLDPAFALQPEFGVKYQFHENGHAILEPLSLPMYIGEFTFLQYRIYFGVGADF